MPLVALGVAVLTFAAVHSASDAQRSSVQQQLDQTTAKGAALQDNQLRHRADVSRSLASALSNSTTRDRADVRAIVRGTILDDRSIQSVWAAYR
ncbi:MAG TPA: hypothetical protein VNT55_22820, partial [Baekduia sp.]|nr:hypothetical protein [Baekduia sp.]